MDLYSILGQQLSVAETLPPEAAPGVDAPALESPTVDFQREAEPSNDPPFNDLPLNDSPFEEDALALRLQAEARLAAMLSSAAERVRYITNAHGVALALCENEEDAMVCHASSGPSAPEVGARMHIRSGITAESIRTRQTLRCDRASVDPRVNQESCKALGIESVMVMPLTLGRNVVGMFELFGARPSAFTERDATTLRAAVPHVESALQEAVTAGMTLGRIPWAEEVTGHVATEAGDSAGEAEAVTDEAGEQEDTTSITLKVPVAFPIDAFRKPELPKNEEPEVPAFLARLADEARPSSNRSWSQWFRPQW